MNPTKPLNRTVAAACFDDRVEKSPSLIESELQQLEAQVHELSEALVQLEDKVAPVLNRGEPLPCNEEKEPEMCPPMANRLHSINRNLMERIRNLRATVRLIDL